MFVGALNSRMRHLSVSSLHSLLSFVCRCLRRLQTCSDSSERCQRLRHCRKKYQGRKGRGGDGYRRRRRAETRCGMERSNARSRTYTFTPERSLEVTFLLVFITENTVTLWASGGGGFGKLGANSQQHLQWTASNNGPLNKDSAGLWSNAVDHVTANHPRCDCECRWEVGN